MRDLKLTFLMLLTCAGCKQLTPGTVQPDRQYDGKLSVYRDLFLDDAIKLGTTVDGKLLDQLRVIKFVDDIAAEKAHYGEAVSASGDTVGTCARVEESSSLDLKFHEWAVSHHSWSEIWVLNSYAEGLSSLSLAGSDALMKELMYHELGHCLLGLEHAPETPHQLMSPEMVQDPTWLTTNWTTLTRTLFQPAF